MFLLDIDHIGVLQRQAGPLFLRLQHQIAQLPFPVDDFARAERVTVHAFPRETDEPAGT